MSFLYSNQQWNPKIGIRWNITDDIQVRAAAFRTLRPVLYIQETIEPTQVAGFVQFLDDFNETSATNYGVGLDINVDGKTKRRLPLIPVAVRLVVDRLESTGVVQPECGASLIVDDHI